ncbi:hypothetical protein D9M69_674350 [compost metagenome]
MAGKEEDRSGLTVYPNPAEGLLTYKVKTGGERLFHLSLFDEQGRLLHREEVDTQGAYEYQGTLNLQKYTVPRLYLQMQGRSFYQTQKIIVLP